jgi:hypothetical protein
MTEPVKPRRSRSREGSAAPPRRRPATRLDRQSATRDAQPVDVVVQLRGLAARLVRLQAEASNLEERSDGILGDLQLLLEQLVEGALPPVVWRRRRGRRSREEEVLQLMAENGVGSLVIRRRWDSAELQIDDGQPVRLTPALADLMDVLVEDRGGSGLLIDWKPLDEIAAALEKRTGRAVTRRTLRQLFWSLRKRLRESGENPFLVQVWRNKGARFALRRPVTPNAAPPRGSRDEK